MSLLGANQCALVAIQLKVIDCEQQLERMECMLLTYAYICNLLVGCCYTAVMLQVEFVTGCCVLGLAGVASVQEARARGN